CARPGGGFFDYW
nr:immunoglobulin heavy chain junction region [Macaca mulatta]